MNPRDARHPKLTPISFTRSHASDLNDIGELERTILVLRASGLSARNFARRDLVAQLARSQKKDGSWEGLVDHTAFAVFGLRAYGYSASSLRSAVLWIERQQNGDGGFGFGPAGGSSDVDDTGSVLQALAAGGRKNSKAARGAISYLRHAQNADGGFGQSKGASSNAQSTAWAVQGLVAVGRRPRRWHATATTRSPTSSRSRPRTGACATRAPACRPRSGSPQRPWSRSPASRCRSRRRS